MKVAVHIIRLVKHWTSQPGTLPIVRRFQKFTRRDRKSVKKITIKINRSKRLRPFKINSLNKLLKNQHYTDKISSNKGSLKDSWKTMSDVIIGKFGLMLLLPTSSLPIKASKSLSGFQNSFI